MYPSPALAIGNRGPLLEKQGTLVEGDALRPAWLTRPEPGPVVLRFVLGRKSDDFAVEARRSLHVFHYQYDLGQLRAEHPGSLRTLIQGRRTGLRDECAGLVASARQVAGQ